MRPATNCWIFPSTFSRRRRDRISSRLCSSVGGRDGCFSSRRSTWNPKGVGTGSLICPGARAKAARSSGAGGRPRAAGRRAGRGGGWGARGCRGRRRPAPAHAARRAEGPEGGGGGGGGGPPAPPAGGGRRARRRRGPWAPGRPAGGEVVWFGGFAC